MIPVYTPQQRNRIREDLIARARRDKRITAGAVTGSAALDREDRWSDIDLAFGVANGDDLNQTIADWTEIMYASHDALHHLDVVVGPTVYRVFLLCSTLQVDLAFSPFDDFGARGPTFQLLFGTANELPQPQTRQAERLIGWAWLYALHARSSLARCRMWQAEYMISGARDQVLSLACLRFGLPSSEGRGLDDLPSDVTTPLSQSLIRSLDQGELSRAFALIVEALIVEIEYVDQSLARRLADPLRTMLH